MPRLSAIMRPEVPRRVDLSSALLVAPYVLRECSLHPTFLVLLVLFHFFPLVFGLFSSLFFSVFSSLSRSCRCVIPGTSTVECAACAACILLCARCVRGLYPLSSLARRGRVRSFSLLPRSFPVFFPLSLSSENGHETRHWREKERQGLGRMGKTN